MRRMTSLVTLLVATAAVIALSACAASPKDENRRRQPPDASSSATVVVPDVIAALEKHRPTPRYTEDPAATALMLSAYAEGFLEAAGLEPDVSLRSASVPDSQEPTAGAVVPRGSVVRVHISANP